MTLVRQALHIRTGQRATVEALDAWLADHAVAVVPVADVYAACVHLLQRYDQVPELVLLGADWLSASELGILRYVRETWPRAAIIVYGAARDWSACELAPLTMVCQGAPELQRLIAQTPAEVVRRIHGEPVPLAASNASGPAAVSAVVAPCPDRPVAVAGETGLLDYSAPAESGALEGAPAAGGAAPRALLTAEELAALLDRSDER